MHFISREAVDSSSLKESLGLKTVDTQTIEKEGGLNSSGHC